MGKKRDREEEDDRRLRDLDDYEYEDDYDDEEDEDYDYEDDDRRERDSDRDYDDSEEDRDSSGHNQDRHGRRKGDSSEKVEDKHGKRRKRKHNRHPILNFFSKFFCLIQTVITALVGYGLIRLDFLPMKYNMIIIGAMCVGLLLTWILGMFRNGGSKFFSIVLSVLISACLALVGFYLYQTYSTLSNITEGQAIMQKDEMVVVVLKDNPYQSVSDISGKTLGIQTTLDVENTTMALEEMNEQMTPTVIKREFAGLAELVQELYNHGVEAILFNATYWDLIEDEFETFTDDTRVLDTFAYEKEVEMAEENANLDVTKDPFIIYMSGIDTYGDVSSRSRSDVNILAVVNPVTKQIALITTPRDYFVPIALDGNPMDKLTHAGIYGIDCSIKTLESLYDIDINYYVRLNFTGFMNVVDALGGVEVYSSQNFDKEGYDFHEGMNTVNGEAALSFVRERYSFKDGDFQRQRNQMEMIRAIIKKIASPAILTTYTSLLDSIATSFNTDMSRDEIGNLVKMQLEEGGDWSISSYGVMGEGTSSTTYSMGNRQLYVCLMDEESIGTAKAWIEKIQNGEVLEDGASAQGN